MARRGQAAMEFLTTYGWAILVVLLAIGALAYFGFTSPKNLVSDSCVLGSGLGCKDFIVTDKIDTLVFSFRIINEMGEPIILTGLELKPYEGFTSSQCSVTQDVALGSDESYLVKCAVDDIPLNEGDRVKASTTITYKKISGTFDHQVSGELVGTVEVEG